MYQELARGVRPSDFVIDLSRDVYATYTRLEGAMYLQSLDNAPQLEGGKRIFDAGQGRIVENIYVAYNHLGIRNIRFTLPGHDLPQLLRDCHRGGVWWTGLARKGGILRLMMRSDVSVIRPTLPSA